MKIQAIVNYEFFCLDQQSWQPNNLIHHLKKNFILYHEYCPWHAARPVKIMRKTFPITLISNKQRLSVEHIHHLTKYSLGLTDLLKAHN